MKGSGGQIYSGEVISATTLIGPNLGPRSQISEQRVK